MAGARRVLIANRGEIARRVSRSCHALGLVPVVVFTEADALSLHVLESDHAVCLGADKRAYTSIDTMVSVAVEHGCAACMLARLLRTPMSVCRASGWAGLLRRVEPCATRGAARHGVRRPCLPYGKWHRRKR